MNSFLPDKNLIIILLLGHLIGDFIFQGNKVYKFKLKGTAGIIWHSFLVSIAVLGVFLFYTEGYALGLAAFLLTFGFHFPIDLIKYKSRIEEALTFMLDQLTHLISILLASTILKNIFSVSFKNTTHMRYGIYAIGMIVIVYFLKYFIMSLYKILEIRNEDSKWYFLMETAERFVIFYFSYMHGFFFLLIAFAVIPRSLYAINNNKQHIFYDIIISMLISSGAGIVLRKATLLEPFNGIEFLIVSLSFFALSFLIQKLSDVFTMPLDRNTQIS